MKQVKIKSISKIEHNSKRYDISVADNNNLFANDILIHNCQNIPHILTQFADKEVYVTEKIDFQSGTWTSKSVPKFNNFLGKIFPINKTIFIVASRNLTNNDKNSLYWKIAEKYNLENICKQNTGIIIQGEQGDTKVQGNKYDINEIKMWVFNIIDSKTNYHYNRKEMEQFCLKHKLDIVPLLKVCKLSELGTTVNEIIEQSKGKSLENNKIHREGIVIRCIENGKKILSVKAINPDFLLKYNE